MKRLNGCRRTRRQGGVRSQPRGGPRIGAGEGSGAVGGLLSDSVGAPCQRSGIALGTSRSAGEVVGAECTFPSASGWRTPATTGCGHHARESSSSPSGNPLESVGFSVAPPPHATSMARRAHVGDAPPSSHAMRGCTHSATHSGPSSAQVEEHHWTPGNEPTAARRESRLARSRFIPRASAGTPSDLSPVSHPSVTKQQRKRYVRTWGWQVRCRRFSRPIPRTARVPLSLLGGFRIPAIDR
jgi:hypothetical protein